MLALTQGGTQIMQRREANPVPHGNNSNKPPLGAFLAGQCRASWRHTHRDLFLCAVVRILYLGVDPSSTTVMVSTPKVAIVSITQSSDSNRPFSASSILEWTACELGSSNPSGKSAAWSWLVPRGPASASIIRATLWARVKPLRYRLPFNARVSLHRRQP